MLESLHICGNILTTKDYSYFALRCVECESPFGQWTSFVKHLIHQHGHDMTWNPACNSDVESREETEVNIEQVVVSAAHANTNPDDDDEENAESEASPIAFESESSDEGQGDNKTEVIEPQINSIGLTKFSFSLRNPELKEMSCEFLRVFKSNRVLWDNQHAKFTTQAAARSDALRALKTHFLKLRYNIEDDMLQRLIQDIIEKFTQARKTLSINGKVDEETQLLLDNCSFLNGVVCSTGETSFSDVDENCVFDENTMQSSSEEEEDSIAGRDTKFYKQGSTFKRIRYHVHPNPLVTELTQLWRMNPVLWDTSRTDYNNISDRKRILTNWIPIFEQRHQVTFTYGELSRNLRILRRVYNNLGKRKVLGEASLYIKEQCSFIPDAKPIVRINCEHCERSFFMQANYQAHLFTAHNIGKNPFECEHCGKCFANSSQLDAHIKGVHIKPYSFFCDVCNRGFLRKHDLTFHMHTHTGEKTFICETCGKAFRRRLNLKNHEIRIHLRLRNFPCELCPKAFYTKALLRDHMNVHLGIRRYLCPTCNKGFHGAHALMRHKQIHSEVKRYACKLCDARFHQFVGLNSHMKSRHKFVEEQKEASSDKNTNVLEAKSVDADAGNVISPSVTLRVEIESDVIESSKNYDLA